MRRSNQFVVCMFCFVVFVCCDLWNRDKGGEIRQREDGEYRKYEPH